MIPTEVQCKALMATCEVLNVKGYKIFGGTWYLIVQCKKNLTVKDIVKIAQAGKITLREVADCLFDYIEDYMEVYQNCHKNY